MLAVIDMICFEVHAMSIDNLVKISLILLIHTWQTKAV